MGISTRLPDFVVIGAAKCATTTLHWWLDQQPDVFMSHQKEPNFFSFPDRWAGGLESYTALFEAAPPDITAGEASTAYTRPEYADVAAARMAGIIPHARLVYVVRHPIDRLGSDYTHHFLDRSIVGQFSQEITGPDNLLVGASCYFARLSPYIDRFSRDHICVVRYEDLVGDSGVGWDSVLDHLHLAPRARPSGGRNITARRRRVSPAVRALRRAKRRVGNPPVPRSLRRAVNARRRVSGDYLKGQSLMPPASVTEYLWDDAGRLEDWLAVGPLWPR